MAQKIIINDVTYEGVQKLTIPKADSPGQSAVFVDTSDGTATATDAIKGTVFYVDGVRIVGDMPESAGSAETIDTKDEVVTIAAGQYTSASTVQLSTAAKNALTSGNLKSGVTILGVTGKPSVVDTELSTGGATASDIAKDKKAYINGEVVTGTHTDPKFSLSGGTLSIS